MVGGSCAEGIIPGGVQSTPGKTGAHRMLSCLGVKRSSGSDGPHLRSRLWYFLCDSATSLSPFPYL